MKTPQQPKRHHFVPECYLKSFMREDGLYTLDIRKVQKGYKEYPRKKTPAQICYDNDYYKIQHAFTEGHFGLDDHDDLFIESDVLREIENKYCDLFRNITTSEMIGIADAIDWSDFIIQMKFRNPFEEKIISLNKDNWIDSNLDTIYTDFLNNPKFAHITEEVQKLANIYIREKYKKDSDLVKKLQLSTLVRRHFNEAGGNKIYRESLVNCRWYLMIAPSNGPHFVTSDNPGFAVMSNDDVTYNTKFIDNFSFYFPLSPDYCLLINDFEKDNCYTDNLKGKAILSQVITPDFIIWINNKTIQRINSLLIASDTWYLSQIAEKNKPKNI